MAELKWIKLATDIFDDEKILLIESLPDAYEIITVWFKLLCLAGKMNNSGVFMMNNRIAYTDKMLSTIFRMKEATVTLALKTFEEFGMIETVDGVITIPNWDKHQSLDAYEKRKERDRLRKAEKRLKIKKLADLSADSRRTSRQTVGTCLPLEEEREEEREEEKERECVEKNDTHTAFYDALVKQYGKTFVDERIERAKQYKNVTLDKVAQWCEEDTEKAKSGKNNTFTTYSGQRKIEIDEATLISNNK